MAIRVAAFGSCSECGTHVVFYQPDDYRGERVEYWSQLRDLIPHDHHVYVQREFRLWCAAPREIDKKLNGSDPKVFLSKTGNLMFQGGL